jgi:ubiquinone/menaquinone biosynthesis C-methylase UbiE
MFIFRDKKLDLNQKWFDGLKKDVEESYLRYSEPWKQSGFRLSEEAWAPCRKPIADCIMKPGSLLDIGCSNGYLLESILKWTVDRGLTVNPYGLDLSEKLIVLARERLPDFREQLFVGSALAWESPVKFDYVRTELSYALEDSQEQYLHRIFNSFLAPNGKLLLTEYRTLKQSVKEPWFNDKIRKWEFTILNQASGFFNDREFTRVLVIVRDPHI